ncbi:MAG TPA: hypothetical protein VJ867_12585 [Gemmatimonadaceae bacterium]|nr:hypothetical protein [Gemmatimonadaceae bacterium]
MRHFYRSHLPPQEVVNRADNFFPQLGLAPLSTAARSRTFSGALGVMKISVKAEGGHYTFVEVYTDQMGESRLDRNVKRFFVTLHRSEDPRHVLEASY